MDFFRDRLNWNIFVIPRAAIFPTTKSRWLKAFWVGSLNKNKKSTLLMAMFRCRLRLKVSVFWKISNFSIDPISVRVKIFRWTEPKGASCRDGWIKKRRLESRVLEGGGGGISWKQNTCTPPWSLAVCGFRNRPEIYRRKPKGRDHLPSKKFQGRCYVKLQWNTWIF